MHKLLALLLSMLSLVVSLNSDSVSIQEIKVTVTVQDFRNDEGDSRLLVFDADKGFPEDYNYAVLQKSKGIESDKVIFSFKLQQGNYAFSVLHDENSNKKLDKTWFGKPTEGFGVTNNPRARVRQPSFDEALVEINEENNSFIINLIYL